MRDPKRIDTVTLKLAEAWRKHPDLRFGQFLTNFFGACGQNVWNTEDDEWLVGLQAFLDGKDPKIAIDSYFDEKHKE